MRMNTISGEKEQKILMFKGQGCEEKKIHEWAKESLMQEGN